MTPRPYSAVELEARVSALEAEQRAFKELMDERDKRYEQRSASQDTSVTASIAASKEAVGKAEASTEKRLETLNELRGLVEDQARAFARKAEVNLLFEAVDKRLDAIAAAVGTAEAALEKRIDANTTLINTKEARGVGFKDAFAYIVGVVGLGIAAVVAFFHR